MEVELQLNGAPRRIAAGADEALLSVLRRLGCASVRGGCDSANCGICTVWVEGKPVLSCTYPACRAQGKQVTTLEGVAEEAERFIRCMAEEGADQCGYCNPGFIMTVLAMKRELSHPTTEEMRQYLAGNLCRCTGYTSHLRALERYFGEEQGYAQGN